MGSIVSINHNPHTWPVHDKGLKTTSAYGNKPILQVEYGTIDDHPYGTQPLTMYMHKQIYDNLLSGRYSIDNQAYTELVILDESDKSIKPLEKDFLY